MLKDLRHAIRVLLHAKGWTIAAAIALGAGSLVKAQLFGLEATDVLTMIAAIVIMAAVSALAGFLPARRASRVDPMVALRYD